VQSEAKLPSRSLSTPPQVLAITPRTQAQRKELTCKAGKREGKTTNGI
jgi:hypothetical protein